MSDFGVELMVLFIFFFQPGCVIFICFTVYVPCGLILL